MYCCAISMCLLRHQRAPPVRETCGLYSMADPDLLGDWAPLQASSTAKPQALSCLTLPSFSDACDLISSRYSCLVVRTHRRHLALPPKYLNKKRSGIQEHLSAELLKYNVVLGGVPVAYDNIKLVGELGDIHDDVGYIHINIEADFVIFQPKCGQRLVGVVNKKAPSHIGCLVHGCFNASIPRPFKIPIDIWQQMEVNIGDQLEFEVFRLDSDAVGVFCIRGRLDKQLEAEALKLEAMSKEENANVPQNCSESAEEEAVGETSVFSKSTSKKKRKRTFEEALSQNEWIENQEDTNLSLQEAPKKKRKKHKHLEVLSQDQSVEVDGSRDNSSMEMSSKLRGSLQNADNDVAVDRTVDGLGDMSVVPTIQERRAKKSKKKKHKGHLELESSLKNGTIEDSLITGDNVLLEREPTTKKQKKKHKTISMILDQDIASASSLEAPTDSNPIIQQETPKLKKRKKKHQDP